MLWTLVKIVVGTAIAIPLAIIALGVGLGILGALFGIAMLALRLGFIVLVCVGLFHVARRLFRGPAPSPVQPMFSAPPAADPHYEAAMRELDLELGNVPRP